MNVYQTVQELVDSRLTGQTPMVLRISLAVDIDDGPSALGAVLWKALTPRVHERPYGVHSIRLDDGDTRMVYGAYDMTLDDALQEFGTRASKDQNLRVSTPSSKVKNLPKVKVRT